MRGGSGQKISTRAGLQCTPGTVIVDIAFAKKLILCEFIYFLFRLF